MANKRIIQKWTPITVEYSFTIDTIEEADCWVHFTKELRALKENRPHKSELDEQCQCGHKHSEHHPIASHNYSAGRCTIGECRCKHFLMPKK